MPNHKPSSHSNNSSKTPREAGYENRNPPIQWLVVGALVLLAAVALIMAMMAGTARYLRHSQQREASAPPGKTHDRSPPGPALQPDPASDWKAYREREIDELNSYGWIDRDQGIVRLPIDRAMELVAERGLPVRHPGEKSKASKTSLQLLQDRATNSLAAPPTASEPGKEPNP